MSVIGDFFTGIGVLGQAKEANEQNKLLAQQQYLDSVQQAKENQLVNEQFDWNKKVAQMNYDLQKDQFSYQKELNDLQVQREDTAYTRAVQDLKSAGLSPLMLSSGASSAPLSSASAPQMDTSGVNQAYASKQDYYARLRQARQFYTQQKFMVHQQNRQMSLQTAQLALQVQKQHYENQLLQGEYEYNKKHGYRNADLQSYLVGLVSAYLDSKKSPTEVVDDAKALVSSANLKVDSKAVEMINKVPDEKVKTGLAVYYAAIKLHGKKAAYNLLPAPLKAMYLIGRNWYQNATHKDDADNEDFE